MKALGEKNPAKVLHAAEKWRPWRAYAAMHLWNSKGEKGILSAGTTTWQILEFRSPEAPDGLQCDRTKLESLFHETKEKGISSVMLIPGQGKLASPRERVQYHSCAMTIQMSHKGLTRVSLIARLVS